MKRMLLLLAVLGVASAAYASMAFAAPTPYSCNGDVGQVTITKALDVPAGATCRLFGTEVQGPITVGNGATLHTFGFTADSNVNVQGGFFVNNNWGFLIKGSLTINGSNGDCCSSNNGFWSDYSPSQINGQFTYTNNAGWFYAASTGGYPITVNGQFTYTGNARPYQGGLTVLGHSTIETPAGW
jgi:hypothetical protein